MRWAYLQQSKKKNLVNGKINSLNHEKSKIFIFFKRSLTFYSNHDLIIIMIMTRFDLLLS